MSIRLLVKQRSNQGGATEATEVILDQSVVLLGRDKSCQVVLAEQAVSRNHARIIREDALCFLEDLGSAYGTSVNGQKLPEREKRLLRNGDVIAIAQFDLVFEHLPALRHLSEKTAFAARHVVRDAVQGLTGAQAFFRIMNGAKEGEHIEIADAKELVIGRDPGCDLVVDDVLISRQHVKIRRDWAGTHVEDLKSRNGIKVNNKRTQHRTLRDKDELQIGKLRLLFVDPSEVKESTGDIPLGGPGSAPKSEPQPVSPPEPKPTEAQGNPVPQPAVNSTPPPSPQGGPQPEMDPAPPPPAEPLKMSARSKMVAIIAMTVFGLVAIAVIVAVLIGA